MNSSERMLLLNIQKQVLLIKSKEVPDLWSTCSEFSSATVIHSRSSVKRGIHQIAKIFVITLWDGVTATSNVEMSVQLCY